MLSYNFLEATFKSTIIQSVSMNHCDILFFGFRGFHSLKCSENLM